MPLISDLLSRFPSLLIFFGSAFIFVAAFLVWYALRRNDEVRAKFGHGKTIFELETKRKRDIP